MEAAAAAAPAEAVAGLPSPYTTLWLSLLSPARHRQRLAAAGQASEARGLLPTWGWNEETAAAAAPRGGWVLLRGPNA